MQVEIDFTTKVEDFVAYSGMKISYTRKALGNEFFIKSHDLLFEQGVNDVEIQTLKWNEVPCFFFMGSKSDIPFDIFAASFYLISRYEEYLPQIKDTHERFKATESLAYSNHFLEKPVVDIWAYQLLATLQQHFPDFKNKPRAYKYISTININKAFTYKHKSILRTIGGFISDLYRFQIFNIINRFAVQFNLKKDPLNTFDKIIQLKKEYNIKTIFFFLIGDYTSYDTNISIAKTKFRLLIKDMVDYARVGLQASYYTMSNNSMLKKEKELLEAVTNIPTIRTRQRYYRFSLPETYQQLIDLEVKEDYSMGYSDYAGFRASTCTPFYFYDLDFEIQTPLKIFPFAITDIMLKEDLQLTPKQSLGKIRDLKNEVKKVNGTFITVFHNDSLSGYKSWRGWQRVYASMLNIVTR